MKYLKIFEKYGQSIKEELVDELDQNTIENYYDEHGGDVEELISLWPNLIWDHIDDDKYVQSWIDSDIQYQSIRDLADKDDFINFLENDWSDEKEQAVIKLWRNQYNNKKYKDKVSKTDGIVSIIELEDSNDHIIKVISTDGKIKKYKIPEEHKILVKDGQHINIGDDLSKLVYEEYMFKDLDQNELQEIIEYLNEDSEYVEFIIRNRYEGYDAKQLIEEIYGDVSKMKSKDLYSIVQWYIDDDAIEKEYKDNQDFSEKKEFIKDEIKDEVSLQREILKNNKSNVLKLAELFIEGGKKNISDKYYFQKLYIKEYLKENKGDDKKGTLKATALKYLNDNFVLNDRIKIEYAKWGWLIDADKYNL